MTEALASLVNVMRVATDGDKTDCTAALVLNEVLENVSLVQGSRHPLGFLHIELTPLVPLKAGERLRLHVWHHEGSAADSAGNVHDHTWGLTSAVLMGALRDRNFVPHPSEHGPYFGARVKYGTPNRFETAGRFGLEMINDRRVEQGGIYKIPPRVVHESHILIAPTVTLVLADESEDGSRLGPLMLNRDEAPSGTAVRPVVKGPALRQELAALAASLTIPEDE